LSKPTIALDDIASDAQLFAQFPLALRLAGSRIAA